MGFISNKERIFDIVLTQYGSELFSKGILIPKFFTVFDSEVCYASGSQDLIIESTPVFEAFSDSE